MPKDQWALFSIIVALSILTQSVPVEGVVTYSPLQPTHEDTIQLTYSPSPEDNTTTVTLMLSVNNTTATNIDMTKMRNNATGEYSYDFGVRSPGTRLSYSVIAWNRTVDDGNISVASVVDVLWHYDLGAAQAIAKRLGRPMLILFWSLGEKASTDLMIGPFNDERIMNLSANFICVKLEVSSDPDLYHQWALDKTPTLVFLNNRSKVVDQVSGPLSSDKVFAHMQYSLGLGPKPKEKVQGFYADPIRNILIVTFLMLLLIAIVAVRAKSWMKRP
jgi:hypothetical protein